MHSTWHRTLRNLQQAESPAPPRAPDTPGELEPSAPLPPAQEPVTAAPIATPEAPTTEAALTPGAAEPRESIGLEEWEARPGGVWLKPAAARRMEPEDLVVWLDDVIRVNVLLVGDEIVIFPRDQLAPSTYSIIMERATELRAARFNLMRAVPPYGPPCERCGYKTYDAGETCLVCQLRVCHGCREWVPNKIDPYCPPCRERRGWVLRPGLPDTIDEDLCGSPPRANRTGAVPTSTGGELWGQGRGGVLTVARTEAASGYPRWGRPRPPVRQQPRAINGAPRMAGPIRGIPLGPLLAGRPPKRPTETGIWLVSRALAGGAFLVEALRAPAYPRPTSPAMLRGGLRIGASIGSSALAPASAYARPLRVAGTAKNMRLIMPNPSLIGGRLAVVHLGVSQDLC
jgi:hypothetical protein